jgi:hypothetical protein
MSTENQIQEGAVTEEERRPLIDSSIFIVYQNGDDTVFPVPNQRLVSLDVFRGLTDSPLRFVFVLSFQLLLLFIQSLHLYNNK